jgi:hypothetical protein
MKPTRKRFRHWIRQLRLRYPPFVRIGRNGDAIMLGATYGDQIRHQFMADVQEPKIQS